MYLRESSKNDSFGAHFFLPDLLDIQRQGFLYLLEKGIVEEIQKRNPICTREKQIEIFFYPEHYRFTKPLYSIEQAIFFQKSYVSKLYIPVQFTDRKRKRIFLKWILLAHFPLMTNRGHFVLNGSPRVLLHQLVRSPGIYFREHLHEVFASKWSEKPTTSFRRFYADIICLKGTWLRLESDKDFSLWAKMKKGPKIPLLWFLLGMGLSEKFIFNSVSKPMNLLESFTKETEKLQKYTSQKEPKYPYLSSSKQVWEEIQKLLKLKKTFSKSAPVPASKTKIIHGLSSRSSKKKQSNSGVLSQSHHDAHSDVSVQTDRKILQKIEAWESGRRWFFTKFMNSRMYDLGKHGRWSLNTKLCLSIPRDQTTLTAFDVLSATDVLMKMQDSSREVDDIDHLKNKRVRSSGECLQEIFRLGVFRFEKYIRLKLAAHMIDESFGAQGGNGNARSFPSLRPKKNEPHVSFFHLHSFLTTRPINGAFREFFGTHPLSQFMDQINPLAEMTHKRRLTSLGPGGVSRDTATLAIRGIHPSHYGRICPIETPEGKNTGLVNSLTTYARLSSEGFLQSPFYKVAKGQIQKHAGVFFLDPEQEERFQIATPDIESSPFQFLSKSSSPVRIGKRFVRMKTHRFALIGISPLQNISVATSFIPFLEHDDANRALMGSNMQRQAVPLVRPERPFLGTGLEARVLCDSGHALFAEKSGYVLYSSGAYILVYTF
jgi:DNA-directed RNA polymerase beta subunit